MRILLADDQTKLPSTLRLWLELLPGFTLVGAVSEVAALAEQVRTLHPDILLLDWELPGLVDNDARQALLQQLRKIEPALRIVALSTEPISRQYALIHHVDAFVSKSESPDYLALVLRRMCHVIDEGT